MSSQIETPSLSDSIETHRRWAQLQLQKAEIDEAGREVYTLLGHLLQKDPSWIISHSEQPFPSEPSQSEFLNLVQRRQSHEPMAYLLGYRDFYQFRFKVQPGVLIPRPDTETMVEWVLEDQASKNYQSGIDLCCGSGNIGISLSKALSIPFDFLDCSESAIQMTQENIESLKLNYPSQVHQRDLLSDSLEQLGRYDLITMNPPYIPRQDENQLAADIRNYEPELALYGGEETGLEFLMQCLPRLHDLTKSKCTLYVELGFNQHKLLKPDASYHGWLLESWKKDLGQIPRIFKWTKQSSNG